MRNTTMRARVRKKRPQPISKSVIAKMTPKNREQAIAYNREIERIRK